MTDSDNTQEKKFPLKNGQRAPAPLGYSCLCHYSLSEQLHLVAEFSAHKIAPERIAYRTGIDIALIDALHKGEYEPVRYRALIDFYRVKRRDERLKKSLRKQGMAQSQLQEKIIRDYTNDIKKG